VSSTTAAQKYQCCPKISANEITATPWIHSASSDEPGDEMSIWFPAISQSGQGRLPVHPPAAARQTPTAARQHRHSRPMNSVDAIPDAVDCHKNLKIEYVFYV
jgi:hypothetical protein